MLRTLHRYRLIFLVFLGISSIALAFSGLGYQFMSPQTSGNAVTIDDHVLTFRDIDNERRELEQMYRAQFGANYRSILESLNIDVPQQSVDRAIQATLLSREAEHIGFSATKSLVARQLTEEFSKFPDPRAQYVQFLEAVGMSPQEFESRFQRSLATSQLEQAFRDSSFASERETRAAVILSQTKYSVSYLALNADQFMGEVPPPSEDTQRNYYEENASDFEVPERVSYSFVSLDPSKFLDIVEIFPDDVEIYYTDHQSDYALPEQRTVRIVEIEQEKSKQKGSREADANTAFNKRIEEIEAELKKGVSFGDIAQRYSKHESAKAKDPSQRGVLGTFTQKEFSKKFNQEATTAVFSLEAGKHSTTIRDNDVARIFLVDAITPARTRELSEVRPEIEKIIRTREAPAFTAVKADELFEEWQKSTLSLADFVAQSSLKDRALALAKSQPLAQRGSDPSDAVGLTERVIDAPDQKKQMHDLGSRIVFVEVSEFKEPEVQAFEAVRDRIIAALKRQEAGTRARTLAQTIVDEMKSKKYPSLEAAASAAGQKVLTEKEIGRNAPPAPFNEGDLKQALFSTAEANQPPTQVFAQSGNYYVLQVTGIHPPSESEVEKSLAESRQTENRELSGLLVASLVNDQKANSRINIQPSVLAR